MEVSSVKNIELFDLGMYSLPDTDLASIDRELILNRSVMNTLEYHGYFVGYYDMINEPKVFISNPIVSSTLSAQGAAGFPLLIVDDEVCLSGSYPTVEEWAEFAEMPNLKDELIPLSESEVMAVTAGSGCSPVDCGTCGGCSTGAFR